jgi:2-C-methyl-D-erythritol 2,4-cyclodiphosphate synthase
VGIGFDIHPLKEGHPLYLGGVRIPSPKGCVGHSDADVLLHAICDALLGACAKGDIGSHFPDSDPLYKDISSIILLEKTLEITEGFAVLSIDSVIIAQSPLLAPYIECMRKNIAKTLKINTSSVSVKAKSPEGVGFLGREEGIAAYAVACLREC